MPRQQQTAAGFSLVELITVLLILTALGTVAVRSTVELGYDSRHHITRERLKQIRAAILGNPQQVVNGQPDISGFVADMGRLPESLRELLESGSCSAGSSSRPSDCASPETWTWNPTPTKAGRCSDNSFTDETTCVNNGHGWLNAGWNGPYLQVSGNANDPDAFSDGWGNVSADNYGWDWNLAGTTLTITSLGRDHTDNAGAIACGDADYKGDCFTTLLEKDYTYDLSLNPISVTFVKAMSPLTPPYGAKALCLKVFYRNNGVIAEVASNNQHTITEDGSAQTLTFSFAAHTIIANGINAIGVYQYDNTATPPVCTANFYPAGRQPIPVLFKPGMAQVMINW